MSHADAYKEEFREELRREVDEFVAFNSEAVDSDAVDFSHPVEDTEKLALQAPLHVRLGQANRDATNAADGDEGGIEFDKGICDATALSLQEAGCEPFPVELPKMRALVLKEARDVGNYSALARHINQYSDERVAKIGFEQAFSSKTYQRAADKVAEAGFTDNVAAAAHYAIYAVIREGIPLPDPTVEKYGISYALGADAAEYNEETRQYALYKLVAKLINIVVSHLDFNRAANTSTDIASLLGVFAHCSRTGDSLEKYETIAKHIFDLDEVFSGSTLRRTIQKMDVDDIHDLFADIYQDFLAYIIDAGQLTGPQTVSYDLTRVSTLEENTETSDYLTADGKARFAALSFTDPGLSFAYGVSLLDSQAEREQVLTRFLRDLITQVDVGLFMADRGFDSAEDIKVCRIYVPERWLIHAKKPKDDADRNDFDRLYEKLEPGGTAVVSEAGFNNLSPPVTLIGYSGATNDDDHEEHKVTEDVSDCEDDGSDHDHEGGVGIEGFVDDETVEKDYDEDGELGPVRTFYTNIPLPDDPDAREALITDLNFAYNQRAQIEVMFRLAKNPFEIPASSENKQLSAFYFQMSLLFYNLYQVVNTVPAPTNGIELETNPDELLAVVRNLTLSAPRPPAALTHLDS